MLTVNQELHREYLRSPGWQAFRLKAIEHYGPICSKCGEYGTDVHHKTYKRAGNERLSDVQILCRGCHEAQHRVERVQGKKRAKRKKKSLSPGGILSYYPQRQLEKVANDIGVSLIDMKRNINCRDRATCIRVAKALGIHVILPRDPIGRRERNKRKGTPESPDH